MLWSAAVFLRPGLWLFLIPALLPVIDLAPRTGWLIVEEFDLLVLGAAAGAYAAIAWRGSARGTGMLIAKDGRLSAAWVTLIWLVGIWTVFALFRGMHGTALTEMDWFDGYYSGANGLRVAKSYLLSLLMLPPLLVETRRSDARTTDMLGAGLVAGLVIASLAIIWERLAFPGLLNFSSDYRTTALFWEMHVGGAALDGFLALTAPFAVREVLVARSGVRRTLAVLCLLLEAYACLTTFSRGVYLAVPISIGLLGFLLLARGSARAYPSAALAILKGCALIVVMCVLSHFAFRAGGYRSLLAVLGVFALTLPFGTIARGIPARPLGRWHHPRLACRHGRKRHGDVSAQGNLLQFCPRICRLFVVPFSCAASTPNAFDDRKPRCLHLADHGSGRRRFRLGWGLGVARHRPRIDSADRIDAVERTRTNPAVA